MGQVSHTLAIEQSNPSSGGGCGVALVRTPADAAVARTHDVLGVEPVRTDDPHHDDLMCAIDRLCARCGIVPGQLARVAVSVGPGGFTGVRIAVIAAKLICEATGAACVGVPSAMVVARRVKSPGALFGVALASKGETAHVTVFDAAGAMTVPGRVIGAAELGALGCKMLVADEYLPGPMRQRAEALGMGIVPPVFDPVACAEASFPLPPIDPALLVPLYPREPEAVTKWRAMHTPRDG